VESVPEWRHGTEVREDIQEIELGSEGIEYVRETLAHGKELSQCLLRILDLESGKLKTFLPPGIAPESVNQFSFGGKLPPTGKRTTVRLWGGREYEAVEIPNVNDVPISIIAAHLESCATAFCIFENALSSAGDGWLKKTPVQTVTCGSSVYHFLTARQTELGLIETTLKRAKSISPPTLGVLSRFSNGSRLDPRLGTIELAELEKIGEQSEKLIVGAYDGEGYLIWSKYGNSREQS
jgi:hypothetical protein